MSNLSLDQVLDSLQLQNPKLYSKANNDVAKQMIYESLLDCLSNDNSSNEYESLDDLVKAFFGQEHTDANAGEPESEEQ